MDCLELAEFSTRALGAGEARVRVKAAGLNRADILQRKGFYPAPPGVPSDIPGLEFSGTIVELAQDVKGWQLGDAVMGIVGGGAMAEELCLDAAQLLPVPAGLSLTEAASLPEAFLTAFDAMQQAKARQAQHIVVHAAPSGVGTAATQLARLWGRTCSGTSRSPEKLEKAKTYGLEHAVWVKDGRFVEDLVALNLPAPDAIIDLVGGEYATQNLEVLAERGRVVHVGLVGGRKTELDLGRLLRKRATLIGTVLRSRPTEEKRALCSDFRQHVLPAFEEGRLEPVLEFALPMADVARAHERMEANATFGKTVLYWGNAEKKGPA